MDSMEQGLAERAVFDEAERSRTSDFSSRVLSGQTVHGIPQAVQGAHGG